MLIKKDLLFSHKLCFVLVYVLLYILVIAERWLWSDLRIYVILILGCFSSMKFSFFIV